MSNAKKRHKHATTVSLPRSLRLTDEQYADVTKAASAAGYPSASAFMRESVLRAARHDDTASELSAIESRMAASLDVMGKRIRALHNAMQMQLAFQDATAKLLLTCLPEPPPEVLEAAKARARQRYDKLMRAVANDMTGDVAGVASELAKRAE